jgi:hypothetical protein
MIFKLGLVVYAVIGISGISIGLNAASAAEPSTPSAQSTPTPKIAPLADKLLTQACAVLGSANAFSFHAEINFDQVLPSAAKVQFAGAMNFALQRPGELAVDYRSDLGAKELWYQNGDLTIFDPPHMVYATATMPPSIDGMLDQAAATSNIAVPLSDLAYSDPCQRIRQQVIFGGYVGVNDVNGIACDHLAFMGPRTELQLWLQHSGKPIPRKIVINYRSTPGSPEYVAVLSNWKFPRKIPASLFHPPLPKNAKKIDILKVKEAKP